MKQRDPSVDTDRHQRRPRLGLRAATATAVLSGALGGGVAYAATSSGPSAKAGALTTGATLRSLRFGAPGNVAPAVIGTVSAVNAASNTFSVKNAAGSIYTVNVSSSTTYRERGDATASLSSVSLGDHVAVIGTTSGTTVTATAVMLGGAQRGPAAWGGGMREGAATAGGT